MMPRIAICAPSTPFSRDDAARITALAEAEFPEHELRFHDQCFAIEATCQYTTSSVWLASSSYESRRMSAIGRQLGSRSLNWEYRSCASTTRSESGM